ncbi:MAG: UDP-N-acetylmuramoyl-L-alanine--D-glutamate ligase [Burkholderiaceae bacterium]
MDIDHTTCALVLGLGESGLAMARWCARRGASVRAWDSREQAPNDAAFARDVPDALRITGELDAKALAGVTLVLKSPGLAPDDARIGVALNAGVPVGGELDLFAVALAQLKAERGYDPKLVAVTGTNGKTTTTAMTAALMARVGLRVAVAGNIGPTMLQTLADALDADAAAESLPEAWVLELSSFQLHEAAGFEPHAATVLNLSEDHLDWHGSMAAYGQAKARVFGSRAVMVVNRDDPAVEAMVPVAPVTAKPRAPKFIAREVVRFGLDAPRHAGDYGVLVEHGMAWLVRALEADPSLRRARGRAAEELHIQRLMPADALRVRGRHNAANALAALALATAVGCPLAPMLHALREYRGEPHRVAPVASLDGVEAFDDSKGTNVGATVAALVGLGQDRAPAKLAVILGGDGKGQDFAPLAAPVRQHARAVATLGRDAARIEAALASTFVPMQRFDTLQAATRWCFEQARPGDAVLLSPACASLDMFRNYGHRAEVFVAEVEAIVHEHGGVIA